MVGRISTFQLEGALATYFSTLKTLANDVHASANLPLTVPAESEVALLTGGFDRTYAFGLALALASKGLGLDVIGSDEVDGPEMHSTPGLRFLNLRGRKLTTDIVSKVSRVLIYYARLVRYALSAKPKIFHILWNNKFETIDRTLLMLYYRLLGKKVVLTAHNVNAGKRDSNDSWLNRLTLRVQYRLAHHIFVHTASMKTELIQDFGIHDRVVSVIPFGINNAVPNTILTSSGARRLLGIGDDEKTILFFGNIRPYKGLEYLVDAFSRLAREGSRYRLIIAGSTLAGCEPYLDKIQRMIDKTISGQIIQKIQFIPDDEIEIYFKAADVLALPYTHVFQSGVLFLAYNFGLPVIGTDVGSVREDIVEGDTGFLCRPSDSVDLARTIEKYFRSDLFESLGSRRRDIRDYANARNSWDRVGEITLNVYQGL